MTRTISANLKTHYASQVRTLAKCWYILRTDTTELFFTDHDKALTISGDIYKSLNSGSTTAIEAKDNLAVDTFDIEAVLNSGDIEADDIKAGRYDHALVWIFEINYESLGDGAVTLAYGHVGEVELHDNYAKCEFRSLAQKLKQNIGRTYMPTCDAQFGDSRCGVTIGSYQASGTVATVTDRHIFTAVGGADDDYDQGHILWTSGDNNGLEMELIRWSDDDTAVLVIPMPFNIQVGNTFTATEGCNKTLTACRDTYDNVINFRGYPHLPGLKVMMEYPDAH